MANTRNVKNPGIWAADALTTIPPLPSQGVSYRDPVTGTDLIRGGWPYAQKVESQDYNEIMYRLTSLLDLIDRRGVLGWNDQVVYSAAAAVFGSDGQLYLWQAANGPGLAAGARDPVSEPAYWRTFSAVYNPPQPAASTTVPGITRYSTDLETQTGLTGNAAVTPTSLATLTALATRAGLSRFATPAETQAGAIGNATVTPAALVTLTSNTGRRGLSRMATTAEALARSEPDAVITPANLGQLNSGTTQVGLTRYATGAEALNDSVNYAALTPTALANRQANQTLVGITRYATGDEVVNDSVSYAAITPSVLAQRTATASRTGIARFGSLAEIRSGTGGGLMVAADILQQSFRDNVPVGTILMWPSTNVSNIKYVGCYGGFLSPTGYAELFALLGYSWGNSGGLFAVPDFRGLFIRGWNAGSGRDPDVGSRFGGDAIPSFQSDQIRAHAHAIPAGRLDTPGGPYVNSDNLNDFGTVSTNSAGGSETRPTNAYVNFMIKALP